MSRGLEATRGEVVIVSPESSDKKEKVFWKRHAQVHFDSDSTSSERALQQRQSHVSAVQQSESSKQQPPAKEQKDGHAQTNRAHTWTQNEKLAIKATKTVRNGSFAPPIQILEIPYEKNY